MSKELAREIRSHKDLEKDSCEFWRPAVTFYEGIATTLIAHGHTLDVFACALEQSGLAEMKPAIQGTGGLVVQTDTFKNPMFKDSLTRVFAAPGDEGFVGRCACAALDVYTSRDIKLQARLPSCDMPRNVPAGQRCRTSSCVLHNPCAKRKRGCCHLFKHLIKFKATHPCVSLCTASISQMRGPGNAHAVKQCRACLAAVRQRKRAAPT